MAKLGQGWEDRNVTWAILTIRITTISRLELLMCLKVMLLVDATTLRLELMKLELFLPSDMKEVEDGRENGPNLFWMMEKYIPDLNIMMDNSMEKDFLCADLMLVNP